jgi:hypothetical protein
MANIAQRAGGVKIRIGGNTQETAVMVDSTPDGRILEKNLTNTSNPVRRLLSHSPHLLIEFEILIKCQTQTPPLIFTPDFLYLMANVSGLVNVHWFLGKLSLLSFLPRVKYRSRIPGIPFFDPPEFNLNISNYGEAILGEYLIGLQVGNEPDLYVAHGHRPDGYGPANYVDEFGELVSAMTNQATLDLLIGPNIDNTWTPESVWDTGFVDTYNQNLISLAVEKSVIYTSQCKYQLLSDLFQIPK